MVPAENRHDRREIGAALCSADRFLCQLSHQMSIEDGLKRNEVCEVALKQRKSFVLQCVEDAHLISHLSCNATRNPDSVQLKTRATYFLSLNLKLTYQSPSISRKQIPSNATLGL